MATGALGLMVSAVMFATCALGNLLGAGLRHGDGSWHFGAGFAEITLVQRIGLTEGMAFGTALLITAAAIVSYYVLPTLWSALFGATSSLKSAASWVDLNKAAGNLYNQEITGARWLQLLIAATLWIFIPLDIGVWRVSRTEIKSS